ncbi:hypothetical protein HCN44_000689 [Aphidius gifuensis]|uniref:Fatty acid desaturase domain-containing protein n=1 Tax=Aphidius gifuensis TaxID=684658 RepID=A0A835CNJ4_APHGI|nr:acyl-CoA Delta-9 desaturase-like [Aphidius gifuensis]KAF7990884.1 hypothetical protein HCN44_000689 [Aphidius gifuensis]
MDKIKSYFEFENSLIWKNVIAIVIFHALTIYTILTFPYRQNKMLMLWAYIVAHISGLGVTAGVHRLWTHRAYKAKTPLRIFLALCYCTAGQNRIYEWVRDHRVHHKFSETTADPHNSSRGFWFSHVGWLMMKKHEDVYEQGRKIDMSDIENDKVVSFIDKHFTIMKIMCCFVIPVVIPVYLFNSPWKLTILSQVLMRYPYVLNSTWSVNSFAHLWGYRSYNKSIGPAENLFVILLSGGEGFHNYHHAFPWDYKASEFAHTIFNPTTAWINFFHKMNWAYDLKKASPEHIKKIAEKQGDGSWVDHYEKSY